jgi:hypothetical protein
MHGILHSYDRDRSLVHIHLPGPVVAHLVLQLVACNAAVASLQQNKPASQIHKQKKTR